MNKITIFDDKTAKITIINKVFGIKECLIDLEDLPRIRMFKWNISHITKRNKTHYVVSQIGGKTISLHRLVMSFPEKQIDHINFNGLDNRKENLREVTASQNCTNKNVQSNNKLGIKGIQKRTFLNGVTKYRSRIRISGKLITLGHSLTIEEAIELRSKAEIEYLKQSF
jgi:hypothetical protein